MGKFGSRQKGKGGEREIAKRFQKWWGSLEPGCEFASTPLSGGWNKASIRGGMKLSGDLCTTAERFPYVAEVKRREKWNLERLLKGLKSPVWAWWEQATNAATEQGGKPLLIFRKNREPWRFMARMDDVPYGLQNDGHVVQHGEEVLLIALLDDLLGYHPEECVCDP